MSETKAAHPQPLVAQTLLFPTSLMFLALGVAVLELLLHRGVLQVVVGLASTEIARDVELVARFVRNLAATLLGLGVVIGTLRAMRSPDIGFGITRRVVLGLLAGVLFPILGVAFFLPDTRTSILVVLLGIVSGYGSAALYALTAFDRRAPIEQRTANALVLLFALASVTAIFCQLASGIAQFGLAPKLLRALRIVIALSYFGLPVVLGLSRLIRRPRARPLAIAYASLAAAITFAAFMALDRALPADFDLLLYGALRLEVAPAASPTAYAALFGLAVAGVTLAMSSPSLRLLGLGAAFILLAGAGAGSPFAVLHVVLAALAIGVVPAEKVESAPVPRVNQRVEGSSSQTPS